MKKQATLLFLFFVVFVITAPVAFAAYNSRIAAPLGAERFSSGSGGFISPEKIRPKRRIQPVSSRKAVVKRTSSPSFIRFRCGNMNFRSYGNLRDVKTVLGSNSIVQLPNFPELGIQIHEYNQDGDIDFNKTIALF